MFFCCLKLYSCTIVRLHHCSKCKTIKCPLCHLISFHAFLLPPPPSTHLLLPTSFHPPPSTHLLLPTSFHPPPSTHLLPPTSFYPHPSIPPLLTPLLTLHPFLLSSLFSSHLFSLVLPTFPTFFPFSPFIFFLPHYHS